MASQQVRTALGQLHRLLGQPEVAALSDSQLLDDFVARRDEKAFEVLVWRHASLVLGVCNRVLRDSHAAEDAFQATYLVFARKAASIGRRESVAGWLYKVAYRIAIRARAASLRHTTEPLLDVPGRDLPDDSDWRELRPVLDEEIGRLPEKYRIPFVLCYLEGQTNEQAAEQIGCPKGTVLSRLSRGREWLRLRLVRRGIVLSSATLSTLSSQSAVAAAPAALVTSTVAVAIPFAAGTAAAGFVPSAVATLTEGVLHAMFVTKLKVAAALVALAVLGTGVGIVGPRALASGPEQTVRIVVSTVPREAEERFAKDVAGSRERAIAYLKKQQNEKGNWEGRNLNFVADMDGGMTAFVTISLLEGGVAGNDPAIAIAVEYLAKLPPKKTYVVSLQTQVLSRVDAKKHAETIQKNVDWLLEKAVRKGNELRGWSYPGNNLADGSNTHFAVFALHAAAKAGAKVDAKVWNEIRAMYVRTAQKDGWTYHSGLAGFASQSMTAAAICGLTIAASYLKDGDDAGKVTDDAWKAFADRKGLRPKSEAYMLHLTAELGRLLDKPVFKVGEMEISWYVTGATTLMKSQQTDGSWRLGNGGIDGMEVYSTAAVLYFLGSTKK